jgi:Holliday junction resolvase-like predicted endonuclease
MLEFIKDSNRKGDLAEYYAVTWLWDNGYEVFRNAGCTGPIDLIAYKDGVTTLVDVKTLHQDRRKDIRVSKSKRTQEQIEKGVVFLGFDPDTRKLRWVDHKK